MNRRPITFLFSLSVHLLFFLILTEILRPSAHLTSLTGVSGESATLDVELHDPGHAKNRNSTTATPFHPSILDTEKRNDPPHVAALTHHHLAPGNSSIRLKAAAAGSGAISLQSGDPYYAEVRSRIESHVRYPLALARRRIQGRVSIELTILSNGRLKSARIHQSSGFDELDRIALGAAHSAAPFGHFDQGLPARRLIVPIDFRFD